jgi:hypothetical protein
VPAYRGNCVTLPSQTLRRKANPSKWSRRGGVKSSGMAFKLTWDDLVIANIPEQDYRTWLGYWSRWGTGRVSPLFMSKFGDWFLRHPDGNTSELSVLEGTHENVARTPDEFSALANSQSWQEQHLLSLLVFQLHERGIVPGPGQCYGFAPHPLLVGRIDLNQVMVMPTGAWQAICVQTLGYSPETQS